MEHKLNSVIRQDVCGTYCVGFLNSYGLALKEIRTIFSDFGNVLSVKETGDERGYRFVRFKYADEAENAVEGLKAHPKIRLVEHRPKPNKKSENRNQNFNENRSQNGNGYVKKSRGNSNGHFEEENQNGNGHFKQESQNNNENPCYDAKSCSSLNSVSDNGKRKRRENSLTSNRSDKSLNVEADCHALRIPDLVTSEELKMTNNIPKKTVLKAAEIIVGNIPNNFGSAFILHLFEHYDPIAISHVNFVKNSMIRYCHVYFKNVQDSLDVERTFDQKSLAGQRLLVLRPSRLLQTTVC